jgi:hypothetical protein
MLHLHPDGAQEFVTRDRGTRPLDEIAEELKLQICEKNRLAVSRDFTAGT